MAPRKKAGAAVSPPRSYGTYDSDSEPTPILGRDSTDGAPVVDRVAKTMPGQGPTLGPEADQRGMVGPLTGGKRNGSAGANGTNRENGHDENSPLLGSRGQREGEDAVAEPEEEPMKFLIDTEPGRFWCIFSVVLLSLFITAFDGTIMASSHPVITSEFHSANSASWLSTAFMLTSTAFQPLLGRLSDALGRKPLFVICMIIFTLSTVWCAVAGNIVSFIAARAVCGLGAGGSGTMGSIITSDIVPLERRGFYQALINIIVGVGGALGAALGGFMAEALGWRWEFGVQVPALVMCCIVAALAIPNGLGKQSNGKTWIDSMREFDLAGSILLSGALTLFTLALSLAGNVLPWDHWVIVGSLVATALAVPMFVFVEKRAIKPVMPLSLLVDVPRANIIYANFLACLIINAIVFNLPLYYQAVLLSSATDSGLRLVVPSVVVSAFGAGTGFAITYFRRIKWAPISGSSLLFVGCIVLAMQRRDLPDYAYPLMLVPYAIGQGIIFPGSFMGLLACSQQKEQAVMTSALILWRSLGLVIGVAYSALVMQNSLLYYLKSYVTGPNAEETIRIVRGSIDAVAKLKDPVVQAQVISSYEAALRVTFLTCVGFAAVMTLLILPIKLPRLAAKK